MTACSVTRPVRLSPRIGAGWQVPPLNKTVVRAGFGVFTNQAAYSVLQNLAENVPFFLNKTVNNATGTPTLTTTGILTANPQWSDRRKRSEPQLQN